MKEILINFNNNGKIVGKLHKVTNSKGLIILVHGFTGTIEGPGKTSWKKLAKALTKENFDVFRFNFRFTSLGWKEFHRMSITSEVSDLRFILQKFSSKYRRIGVVAESMGGAISILAFEKRINCLVLWYPVIDFRGTTLRVTLSNLKELKKFGYVTIRKRSTGELIRVGKKFIIERLKLAPYKNLKSITCPTLIIHSDKDTVVPFSQAVRALKLIKSKNKKLFKIKNSDHAWWKLGKRVRDLTSENIAIKQTANWLKVYLK